MNLNFTVRVTAGDPRLTLNVYTRPGVHDLIGALDALPSVADDKPNTERQRATGNRQQAHTTVQPRTP